MNEEHDDTDRDLLEQLGALPRQIEPARDLWSEVESRITAPPRRGRTPLLVGLGAVLAAAAGVALWVGQPEQPEPAGDVARIQESAAPDPVPPVPAEESAGEPTADELLPAETDYLAAATELGQAIEDRRGQLPGELARVYDENLAVVDRAIADSRTALAADPDDAALREALDHAYQQKLELLQQVSQIPVRS